MESNKIKLYVLTIILCFSYAFADSQVSPEQVSPGQVDRDVAVIDKLLSYANQELVELENLWNQIDSELKSEIEKSRDDIVALHKILRELEPKLEKIELEIEEKEKLIRELEENKKLLLEPPFAEATGDTPKPVAAKKRPKKTRRKVYRSRSRANTKKKTNPAQRREPRTITHFTPDNRPLMPGAYRQGQEIEEDTKIKSQIRRYSLKSKAEEEEPEPEPVEKIR
jgi:hypothetical protein